MKKLTLMIAFALIGLSTMAQENKGIGRVQKTLGVEVYVMCEPLREYDIVEKMTTSTTTILSGRQTIQKQMQEVVSRSIKRKEKGKLKDFDAVMTDDGDVVVIIKFKQ